MTYQNPFSADPDRAQIWTMLVERDIRAYVASDWSQVAEDFLADEFVAVTGRGRSNPDSWRLGFPALESYRDSWVGNGRRLREQVPDLEQGLHDATTLRDIEIEGGRAIAHKKFDGQLRRHDGSTVRLRSQTLYLCKQVDGRWRIQGFVGYLPNPMGDAGEPPRSAAPGKELPEGATQHAGAGPYSPALTVRAERLVVISGQAAIGKDGSVVGGGIEEQARATLDNCARQLATAGCTFQDVFKVNVFLTDLADWQAFNDVYREVMPEPRPVRTAVGTGLLPGLLVEVEMWAAGTDSS